MLSPSAYRGMAGFHKYWGKKPVECLAYLVERFSQPGELVVDPFMGSGLVARETLELGRQFIGCDINPVAVQLATLLMFPPDSEELREAFEYVRSTCARAIGESYATADGEIASHYLWRDDEMVEVWRRIGTRRKVQMEPTSHDRRLAREFAAYQSRHLRPISVFSNSRINSNADLCLGDLFTGRALRNIDLLLDSVRRFEDPVRRALLLSVTAASGQMSNMVFAITNRGKALGKTESRTEVGSWVIGFWRPQLHFEISVWNCFESRLRKLLGALGRVNHVRADGCCSNVEAVVNGHHALALTNNDALATLQSLPDGSAALILTDPPHSDRIPYLELSEIWNSILNAKCDFEREIVISNARERGKTRDAYAKAMQLVLRESARVLKPDGVLTFLFNSRRAADWRFLDDEFVNSIGLTPMGSFPMTYSAASVVQDNRDGALREDRVLLYVKASDATDKHRQGLDGIPGWSVSARVGGSE